MTRAALVLVVLAAPALAQTPADPAALAYAARHRDIGSGAYAGTLGGSPSIRATNAALRIRKYLGSPAADASGAAAFVRRCYDSATGRFADAPGGPATPASTAVGVMAAVETGLPAERFPKSKEYLAAECKTFEDARLGAAAFEALGLKGDAAPPAWRDLALAELAGALKRDDARGVGGASAMLLRLGWELPDRSAVVAAIRKGRRPDGAWGPAGSTTSDLDATYRVMRALHLLGEPPADPAALRAFLAKCRNPDGGSGPAPGKPSGLGTIYYAAIVGHWLKGR